MLNGLRAPTSFKVSETTSLTVKIPFESTKVKKSTACKIICVNLKNETFRELNSLPAVYPEDFFKIQVFLLLIAIFASDLLLQCYVTNREQLYLRRGRKRKNEM